jgi:hypothetical protein
MPQVRTVVDPAGSPERIDEQLQQVKARLVSRYCADGRLGEETVRQRFAEAVDSFADARIRTYLPVLVERMVRARLPN